MTIKRRHTKSKNVILLLKNSFIQACFCLILFHLLRVFYHFLLVLVMLREVLLFVLQFLCNRNDAQSSKSQTRRRVYPFDKDVRNNFGIFSSDFQSGNLEQF